MDIASTSAHAAPVTTRRLNSKDALRYLDTAKDRLIDTSDIYYAFFTIVSDIKNKVYVHESPCILFGSLLHLFFRIDESEAAKHVTTLFRDHNDLIQGFCVFLAP